MQKLETTIAELAKSAEALGAKRATVQQALDKAIAARQTSFLAGVVDDHVILKLQAAVDSATSMLSGIDDALAVLAKQQAEAERQLAEKRESANRVKAAGEIAAMAATIERRVEPLLSELRGMAAELAATDHLAFEAGQLGQFLSGAAGEAELALAFVLPMFRDLATGVKDGHVPIPRRPQAAEPAVIERPASEPHRAVHSATRPPHVEPVMISDPVVASANFTVIDRSREARKIAIEGARL